MRIFYGAMNYFYDVLGKQAAFKGIESRKRLFPGVHKDSFRHHNNSVLDISFLGDYNSEKADRKCSQKQPQSRQPMPPVEDCLPEGGGSFFVSQEIIQGKGETP